MVSTVVETVCWTRAAVVDVVSDGPYIEAGATIEVTRVDGNRVVVRERSGTRNGERHE